MSRRAAVLLLCLAAALACGCGEEPPRPAPATATPPRPLPVLPAVDPRARARYAFDRLTRGPRPLAGLRVPDIHSRNLQLAQDDLRRLEPHTLALLSEAAHVERITGMALRVVRPPARPNGDPWLNVLVLLQGLGTRPPETVLAWTRPVLGIDPRSPLAGLRLEAARLLATLRDPRAGPVLTALLEADPADRQLGVVAVPGLVALGSPWRERALGLVLGGASQAVWEGVPGVLREGPMADARDDVLAWWAALSEGTGPRMPTAMPLHKTWPWMEGRLWVDPAVPRHGATSPRAVYGPLPGAVARGHGWLADAEAAHGVFPLFAYGLTGRLAAARARCALAQAGHAAYAASVEADLAAPPREGGDEDLHRIAWTCRLEDPGRDAGTVRRWLAERLEEDARAPVRRATEIARLIEALPGRLEDEDQALLVRVLRELRPLDAYRAALEHAYDAMAPRYEERRALILSMLAGREEDPPSAGLALYLIRHAADPVYLPALEAQLEAARDPASISGLRKLIVYLHARGEGIAAQRRAACVERLLAWTREGPDDASGDPLLPALLDLGPAGARAFAEGLRGAQRARFLRSWPRAVTRVPVEVARAAVDPIDRRTSARELQQVLAIAYLAFPADAAAALAGLRARVAKTSRPWVDAALERVRHRAP